MKTHLRFITGPISLRTVLSCSSVVSNAILATAKTHSLSKWVHKLSIFTYLMEHRISLHFYALSLHTLLLVSPNIDLIAFSLGCSSLRPPSLPRIPAILTSKCMCTLSPESFRLDYPRVVGGPGVGRAGGGGVALY